MRLRSRAAEWTFAAVARNERASEDRARHRKGPCPDGREGRWSQRRLLRSLSNLARRASHLERDGILLCVERFSYRAHLLRAGAAAPYLAREVFRKQVCAHLSQ